MKIQMKDLSELRSVEVIDVINQQEDLIITASIFRDQSISIKCQSVNDRVNCRISEDYIVNFVVDRSEISESEVIVKSGEFEYVQTRIEVKIEDSRYLREDLEEMITSEITEKIRSQTLENRDSAYLLRSEDE